MRIWHQSFTVLEDLPAYAAAIKTHMRHVLREDTEVVLHGQRQGTYPHNYPGDDLVYSYLYLMHGHQWVERAQTAEHEGFDAYAMCSLVNPLINEIRTLVDIPVVGYGESVFHLASLYGRRFGVLLFMDKTAPLYHEQLHSYGLASNCAGISGSNITFMDVLSGFKEPGPVIDRFCTAAEKLIHERGADVIVPGEMPMSMLLALNGVNRVGDVPIMDGLAITLKMTELAVDLQRTTGMRHSRHGWRNAAPPKARVQQVTTFYGLDQFSHVMD